MGPRVLLLLLSLPWSRRDPPILACNHMQSCNHAIRRISLTAHRRGATKPYPLPRRASSSTRPLVRAPLTRNVALVAARQENTERPIAVRRRTNERWVTQDTDGRPPSDNRQILPITKRRPDPRPHRD